MKDGKKVVWFNNWLSAIVVTINDLKKKLKISTKNIIAKMNLMKQIL